MADQGSEGLLSSFLRHQRVRAAAPLLRGRVLDFGCGSGVLAGVCPPDRYFGFDPDRGAIELAQRRFSGHCFSTHVPLPERFDTIVSLAVIEHLPDPGAVAARWRGMLEGGGQIVLTTPHPSVGWVHTLGAKIGLFSTHAAEEHQALIDCARMKLIASAAGLRVASYRRFVFGANQLFILESV